MNSRDEVTFPALKEHCILCLGVKDFIVIKDFNSLNLGYFLQYQLKPYPNTIATCYKCHCIMWLVGQKLAKERFLGQEIHEVGRRVR